VLALKIKGDSPSGEWDLNNELRPSAERRISITPVLRGWRDLLGTAGLEPLASLENDRFEEIPVMHIFDLQNVSIGTSAAARYDPDDARPFGQLPAIT
jgi:hypothetical protein